MTILRDVQKLIDLAEGKHPRLETWALWNIAKRKALRTAVVLETEWKDGENDGAREGSQGEDECQEPGNPEASTNDLNGTLAELLRRPLRGTSQSSKAKTNVVSLPPSNRLPRT